MSKGTMTCLDHSQPQQVEHIIVNAKEKPEWINEVVKAVKELKFEVHVPSQTPEVHVRVPEQRPPEIKFEPVIRMPDAPPIVKVYPAISVDAPNYQDFFKAILLLFGINTAIFLALGISWGLRWYLGNH